MPMSCLGEFTNDIFFFKDGCNKSLQSFGNGIPALIPSFYQYNQII